MTEAITAEALRALADAGDYNTAPELREAADRIEALEKEREALIRGLRAEYLDERDEAVALLRRAHPKFYIDAKAIDAFLTRLDGENT